nr:HEPN domain-containing protein [uncultured Pseudodesulfovibrio sp.]
MNSFVNNLTDDILKARYAGFASVAGCGVYELSIKSLLLRFAKTRDRIFFNYVEKKFDRINARIKLQDLKRDYLQRFGTKYVTNFTDLIHFEEEQQIKNNRISITSSYSNIIQWRHNFAHEGKTPQYASFNEVIDSYNAGKTILDCFYITIFDT